MLSEYDRELLSLIDGRSTYLPNAKKAQNKTGLSQRAVENYVAVTESGAIDDGDPPANPTGITVDPGIKSLTITWAPPPRSDGVVKTIIRRTRSSPLAEFTKEVRQSGYTWSNVSSYAPVTHLIEVKHVDAWGRESGWVSGGSHSPQQAASADISDLVAGKITLQDSAITEGTYPSAGTSDWLIPAGGTGAPLPFAGVGFFQDPSGDNGISTRGILLRASAQAAGSKKSRIIMSADDGDQDGNAETTAKIRLESANPFARIKLQGQVNVNGPTDEVPIDGVFYKSGNISSGGQWSSDIAITARRLDDIVIMRGVVHNNSGTGNGDGAVICTLPTDFRPASFKRIVCSTTSGAPTHVWNRRIGLIIESNGEIRINAASGETVPASEKVALDSMVFTLD